MTGNKLPQKLLILLLIPVFFSILPISDAHILIIANGDNTTPESYQVVKETAEVLKSKGFEVLELYGENATTKQILKGMYNADAVIYAGHGVFIEGNYNGNGGIASPPFGIVGSDGIIWGVDHKMQEGNSGNSFKAPFKGNIPVILFGACFSSGWVEHNEVSNPTETIKSFSDMFTSSKANYYATAYSRKYQGREIVDVVALFLNGATTWKDVNNKNYGLTITQSENYQNQVIWHNNHGYNAFVGNWSGRFPKANQTTPYNDTAAEEWYQGTLKPPTSELSNVEVDDSKIDIEQLFYEFLAWINYLISSIFNGENTNIVNITLS
ncbi:MAG: hypothetical protein LLF83_06295 [Methanobacterium sp.]|nr:hypothetical protein [Methanobacterium sp.]